jgi:hypothetical protein
LSTILQIISNLMAYINPYTQQSSAGNAPKLVQEDWTKQQSVPVWGGVSTTPQVLQQTAPLYYQQNYTLDTSTGAQDSKTPGAQDSKTPSGNEGNTGGGGNPPRATARPGDKDFDANAFGGWNFALGRYNDQIRGDISSGYDAYFGQLDSMLGDLPNQQNTQEQMVNNQYNQGVSDLNAQKDMSMQDLATSRRKNEEQQVKSLKDIASNIRNLMQAGQVYLGARGAGDSSAANMYSYALTKEGSKQRANVLSQTRSIENDIADREAKLNTVVTQELGRLKTERDNNILQIVSEFQNAKQRLQEAKARGQLEKGQSLASLSQSLLQQAQARLMQEDQNFKNRQNTLLSWAASNATNINQLKSNLSAIGQYNVNPVSATPINGTPQFDAQGNMITYFGSGSREKEKYPTTLSGIGNYI